LTKRLLLLCACFLLEASAKSAFSAEETNRFFVSTISRDLEIVAEVSTTDPLVGQQLSVIYSLRAAQALSAVDVDPQQYSGFWTVLAPLPEQPRSTVRFIEGRRVYEFLLRQLIAFPLWAGSLELPPLRVKVKRVDSRASSPDAWDVIGISAPILLKVNPLPPAVEYSSMPPFVGELEGSLLEDKRSERFELLLELRGTVNLALLKPEEWLKAPDQVRFIVRLKDWDNIIQTRDTGDTRQLSLLQRRNWSIHVAGRPVASLHIEDIAIPLFQPNSGHWTSVRIKGLDLARGSAAWTAEDSQTNPTQEHDGVLQGPWRRALLTGLIGATLLLFLVIIFLKQWMWRRRLYSSKWSSHVLASLEKKLHTSPRSFLDLAHKVLVRYAKEKQAPAVKMTANETFDRCWHLVEHHRFSSAPPSQIAQVEILAALRTLIHEPPPEIQSSVR